MIHLRRRAICAAALVVAASANLFAASNTRTENFNSDPGWDGHNNRATTPAPVDINQNFGFSQATNNAGGGFPFGEIGGSITPAAEAAYYAKILTTPLTLNDSFTATGTLNVPTGSGHTLIGFFNNNTINEWRTPNSVALRIQGEGSTFNWYTEYATGLWRAGGSGASVLSSGSTDRTFSLTYDPNGNGGGGTVTGVLGGNTVLVNLDPGHKADGATFNRFGILNVMKSADTPGSLWLDNVNINNTGVQNFTTDPGWDSLRNRSSNGGSYTTVNVRPRFNFGYSATHNAGGAASGEMGGLTWRGDSRVQFNGTRMAYYGDRLDSTLTLDQPLVASGKVSFNRGVTDATTLIGFFHSADSIQNNDSQASALPENFVGAAIEGPSREGHFFYPAYAVNQEASGQGNGNQPNLPYIYPNGASHDWSLRYDPTANNGVGAITITLDGHAATLNLQSSLRDIGAHFDRFGIITTQIDGNGHTVFFDDLTYTVGLAGPQWGVDGSGNWQTATNWIGGLPNGAGAIATFGDLYLSTDPRVVFSHTPVTVGTLNFNRGGAYVLSGAGSLTLQTSSGSAAVNVQNGTHKINLPLTIASNTTLNVSPGATLKISDPVTVNAGKSLTQSPGGTVLYESTVTLLTGASATFASSQHLQALSVGADAVVDLTDGALAIAGGDYRGLEELVKQGFNGGAWTGKGITSSTARGDLKHATALGIVDNSAAGYSKFAGFSALQGNEILIGYTRYGDADLGGTVNLDDFNRFLSGFNGRGTTGAPSAIWRNGDFDYSGVVDLDDFKLFLRGLQYQPSPVISPDLLAALTDFAGDQHLDVDLSWVPEPSSLALLGLGALGLLRRRGQRRRKFAVAAMTPVIAAGMPALGAVVPTVYDDFTTDSDARWIGINNRPPGTTDFGWSNSDNTGTSPTAPSGMVSGGGELGGALARGSGAEYSFDTGPIFGNDILHADGVYRYSSGSGAWFLGWYNSTSHYFAGGDPRNFVGMLFDDSTKVYSTVANDSAPQRTGPHTTLTATTVQWSMDYNGAGTLTGTINGVPFTAPSNSTYMNGVTMDRFGFFSATTSDQVGFFYFDDMTFSSNKTIPPPPTGSVWRVNKDDDWFVPGNWINGVPNAVGAEATFGSVISSAKLVYANNPVTVGTVHFDNASTYVLDGFGSLTLQVSSGTGLVEVKQGTQKINLPLVVASNAEFKVASGGTLKISDPITINAGKSLTQSGPGVVTYESTVTVQTGSSIQFGNSSYLAALTMAAGAAAELSSSTGSALKVDSLSMANTAKIDLEVNKLIVANGNIGSWNGSAYTGITGLIASGRNGGPPGSRWGGSGIVTSQSNATSGNFTSIGVASASQVKAIAATATAVWAGQTVTGGNTLVMYTYGGDANLDGKINVDDYGRIDFNVPLGTSGWFNGDFNYDGKINVDDYGIIDFNIGIQGPPFATGAVAAGSGLAAVPEPAGMIVLWAVAGSSLLVRRRRY